MLQFGSIMAHTAKIFETQRSCPACSPPLPSESAFKVFFW